MHNLIIIWVNKVILKWLTEITNELISSGESGDKYYKTYIIINTYKWLINVYKWLINVWRQMTYKCLQN